MQHPRCRTATTPMIITCPSCRTRFEIAPAALGSAGSDGALLAAAASAGSSIRSPRRRRHHRWRRAPVDSPPIGLAPSPNGQPKRRGTLVGWLLATLSRAAADRSRRRPQRDRGPVAGDRAALPADWGCPLELPLGMEFRELSSLQRRGCGAPGAGGHRRDRQRLRPAARACRRSASPCSMPSGRSWTSACSIRRSRRSGRARLTRFEVELGAPPPEASDYSVSFGEPR